VCLTLPILPGTDGVRRMGKSLGNYIGINDPPSEMYGKVMSIPDDVMPTYFELLTDFTPEEIRRMLSGHPRDAKAALALRLTEMYHGREAAKAAAAEFDRVFRRKDLPEDIPTVRLSANLVKEGVAPIIELLRATGLVATNSEARRLIGQGGVSVDGERIADIDAKVPLRNGIVVQVGKRKFARVSVE